MGVRDIDLTFERQLAGFTPANANRITFNLGRPSHKLRAAGVADKTIRLYGNKLMAKIRKHGYSPNEISGLTKAVRNPIAVFQTHGKDNSYAILTPIRTTDKNFLVALRLGKGGVDADLLMVTSVYKKGDYGVINWINKGYLRYVDRKKALRYLHSAAPIAAASDIEELKSAAKIVTFFSNPKFLNRNLANNVG